MSPPKMKKGKLTDGPVDFQESASSKKRKFLCNKTDISNKKVNNSWLKNINFPRTDTYFKLPVFTTKVDKCHGPKDVKVQLKKKHNIRSEDKNVQKMKTKNLGSVKQRKVFKDNTGLQQIKKKYQSESVAEDASMKDFAFSKLDKNHKHINFKNKNKKIGNSDDICNKKVTKSQLKNINFPSTDTYFKWPVFTTTVDKSHGPKDVKVQLKKKDNIHSEDKNVQKLKTKNLGTVKQRQLFKDDIGLQQIKKKYQSESVAEDTSKKDFASSKLGKNHKRIKFKNKNKKIVGNSDDELLPKKFNKDEDAKVKTELDKSVCRTLFVGNLPISITRKDLEKMFSSFGPLDSVRLRGAIPVKSHIPKRVADITRVYHSGVHSRIGYVVFKNENDAVKALNLNGSLLENHHIVVDRATPPKTKKMYDDKLTIFVGNLPFDVDDDTVWSAFAPCGEIDAVRVIRDQNSGVGKGFGYVLFKEIKSKEDALNLNKVEISGRILRIKSINGEKNKDKTPNNQWNAMKRKALKMKSKQGETSSRKSVKKIMKKERLNHQKKKIASKFKNIFQK